MDDLRIQIVNYRTKKYLIQCVGSLLDDLRPSAIKAKIAILDNASGDDLSDIKNLFPDAPISIFENQENMGFGAGHNLLAAKSMAETRYLLILNPDIKVQEENTLVRMLRQADKLAADVIGPRLVTTANKTQHWDHGELRGSLARITLAAGGSYWKEQDKLTEAAWVSGAFFLIRKKLFDKIGGFDENSSFTKKRRIFACGYGKKAGTFGTIPASRRFITEVSSRKNQTTCKNQRSIF